MFYLFNKHISWNSISGINSSSSKLTDIQKKYLENFMKLVGHHVNSHARQQMIPQQSSFQPTNSIHRSMHGNHHGQASQRPLQNLASRNFFENFQLSAGEKDALKHIDSKNFSFSVSQLSRFLRVDETVVSVSI